MKFKDLLIFTVGATIGSAVTYKIMQAKHEIEMDNLVDYFENKDDEIVEEEDEEDMFKEDEYEDPITPEIQKQQYASILQENNYSNEIKKEESDRTMPAPYVISPDECGEEYDVTYLSYYSDEILAEDSTNDILDDPDHYVGMDFVEHFGDYENDIVHVRNDELQTDYEICRVIGTYDEVVGSAD